MALIFTNIENHQNMEILSDKKHLSRDAVNKLIEKVGWGNFYYATEEKWQHVLNVSTHIANI